jgi:hypothetical protein
MKNRLLANTQANLDDAKALVYKIQQVKEVLPHMKPHDIMKSKQTTENKDLSSPSYGDY